MQSIISTKGRFSINRFSYLSYKNISMNEIKRRKLQSLKSTGNFSENPSSDESKIRKLIKPRTETDITKIKNFIKTTENDKFQEKAKKNEEFNNFFTEFKEKNKDKWSSIINGMEITDDLLKQETEEEKKDEIVMLKELSNRRKFKKFFDDVRSPDRNQEDEGEEQENLLDKGNAEPYNKHPAREMEKEKGEDEFENLTPDMTLGEMYDASQFNLIFLDADAICNVTRLNRIMRRRCLLYMGNKDGLISYGMGRGYTYQDAYEDAFRELKKNIIQIQVDPLNTCPSALISRYHDYHIKIFARREPNIWGSPLFTLILRYAGLVHVGFALKSRKDDPYAMIFAFFKAVTKNRTPQYKAHVKAVKIDNMTIGKPARYTTPRV